MSAFCVLRKEILDFRKVIMHLTRFLLLVFCIRVVHVPFTDKCHILNVFFSKLYLATIIDNALSHGSVNNRNLFYRLFALKMHAVILCLRRT